MEEVFIFKHDYNLYCKADMLLPYKERNVMTQLWIVYLQIKLCFMIST